MTPSRKSIMLWVVAIFLIGLGLRLAIFLYLDKNQRPLSCEAVNIAISLTKTGTYADAYGPGVGPTAHCAPLQPLLMSALFDIFGINARGDLAINIAASIASSLAFALLPFLAIASKLPPFSGVLGGIAGALLPLDFFYQTKGNFDQPFTSAVLVALCILVFSIRARARFTKRDGVILGICTGVGCLLSPVMLPVVVAWVIVSVVQHRRQLQHMLAFSGIGGICLVATLSPWAIRNYEILGSPIFTRSDFWLEMNASNNNVLTANEEINLSDPQFALFHPYTGAGERVKVKRLGEVAYMRTKRAQFLAWLPTHKRRFLELTAERFRLFWIPKMKRPIQTILEAVLTILGLSGLVLLFLFRASSAWIYLALVALYPAAYYLIMVSPRFRVPLEPFLFLLAGYFCYTVLLRLYAGRLHTVSARP